MASSQTVNVVLESRVKDPDDKPIQVKPYLGSTFIDYTADPTMTIMAEVTKGYLPVLNADVIATVEGPSGSSAIPLFDNGAGADVAKDDGVYATFFTNYTSCTRTICKYGAKVKVKNNGEAVIVTYGDENSPAFVVNTENSTELEVTTVSADPFSRVLSAGAFDVQGGPDGSLSSPVDVFPPARVQDLEVEDTDYENGIVVLAWTAVGDDFDQGTAQEYDLRMSGDVDELYDNLDNTTQLTDEDLLWGNLTSPQVSGSRESVALNVNNTGGNYTYAFSVRAVDGAGNIGDPSNVVFTSIVYIPPSLLSPFTTIETTTEEPTTKPDTTTELPTTDDTTTEPPTTKSDTTTEQPTTKFYTTTVQPTTVSDTTTVLPTTNSDTTTVQPTTKSDTTTVQPTTKSDTTTVQPTTVSDTTAVLPTTVSDTTTTQLSSYAPTTEEESTASVTETTSTGLPDKESSQTMSLEVIVVLSATGAVLYFSIILIIVVGMTKREARQTKKMTEEKKKNYLDNFTTAQPIKIPRAVFRNVYLPAPQMSSSLLKGQEKFARNRDVDVESSTFTDYEDIPDNIGITHDSRPLSQNQVQEGLHSQINPAYKEPPVMYYH